MKSVVVTVLSGNFLALLLSNSLAFLLRLVLCLLPWNLVTLLLRYIVGNLPVLSSAILSVFGVALLLGNIVALLPWNLLVLAVLSRDLVANLVGNLLAHLLRFIVKVGDRFGSAFLQGDLLTVLLGNLLTLLSWLIPALLMTIDIGALAFSYSVALLLISSVAFLLIPGITLIFLLVFLHRFASIVTFLAVLRSALIVNGGVTFLFINSVTFLLILGLALLFRNILTFLLRNRVDLGNLDDVALFLVHSGGKGLLHIVTLLTRFIPALIFPNSGTNGEPGLCNAN